MTDKHPHAEMDPRIALANMEAMKKRIMSHVRGVAYLHGERCAREIVGCYGMQPGDWEGWIISACVNACTELLDDLHGINANKNHDQA